MTDRDDLPAARNPAWFAAPWIVGLLVLTFLPLVASLVLSFTQWDGTPDSPPQWVGLGNYRALLGGDSTGEQRPTSASQTPTRGPQADPRFKKALFNSAHFSALAVPLSLATSLAMALLLNAPVRGLAWFRAMFYLPHVLGGVATMLVWSWIFNPRFGPLNQLLTALIGAVAPLLNALGMDGVDHWQSPNWLFSEDWCRPALAIMAAWTAGGSVFIFLAAMQQIDQTVYDAADLDGAGATRRFLHVTLPQLSPAILFNAITGLAASMQAFNQAYLLYNRSQNDGLLFYVLHLYRTAFEPPYRLGLASAMATILLVGLFVLSLSAVWISRRWVHYES